MISKAEQPSAAPVPSNGQAGAPQLALAPRLAPVLAGVNDPDPMKAKLAKVRGNVLKAIDAKLPAPQAAITLIEYCSIVRDNDPSDTDVVSFWADPTAGVDRLLGSYLNQKGGDGAAYLQAIKKAMPGAIETWNDERNDERNDDADETVGAELGADESAT